MRPTTVHLHLLTRYHLFCFSVSFFLSLMAAFSSSSSSLYALLLIPLLCFTCSSLAEARDHLVGGKSDSWKIPSSQSDSLNHWAENSRFLVGDSLVWKYDGSKDSVLQVTKRDYVTCNTSSPVAAHSDGNTEVKLEHSGPYYFISGAQGHCEKGQKLIVVVLSDKRRRFLAPAPSPFMEIQAPAPAPASSAANFKASFLMAALLGLLGFLFF